MAGLPEGTMVTFISIKLAGDSEVTINADAISTAEPISPGNFAAGTQVVMRDGTRYVTKTSYEDIKRSLEPVVV
jgi:hypothetical protein